MGHRWVVGFCGLLLLFITNGCGSRGGVTDGGQSDITTVVPENTPTRCQDGIDNDGDGVTDCQDSDCWVLKFCLDASVQDGPPADGVAPDGAADGGQSDTSAPDAPAPDTAPPPDLGVPDAPAPDTAPPPDVGPPDAPAPDTMPPDTMPPDTMPPDTMPPDTMPPDTMPPDTMPPDTMPPDTMPPDTMPPDTMPPDTMPPDAGTGVPGIWVTIPPTGTVPVTFSMGSPKTEPCRYGTEDLHQVTLTHKYEITAHEVTQGEFQAMMGYNPSYFSSCGTTCPVDRLRWHEAVAYCNALSDMAGLAKCYSCSGSGSLVTCSEAASYSGQQVYDCPGYRLPTEAEWEHAYRAGSSTALYPSAGNNGTITNCVSDANADQIAWYSATAGNTPHPVGQKAPNAWGLFDMAGNVYEWCHDWFQTNLGSAAVTDPWGAASGTGRAWRGGSWAGHVHPLRAAYRYGYPPTSLTNTSGFRCVRTK